MPPNAREPVTPGSADRFSRFLGFALLVIIGSALLTSVTLTPSKRNIEVLAAAIFMGIVLIAHPRKALYFTLLVLPFPARTSVGTTSSLLIFALAALVLVKSKELRLPSAFQNVRVDTFLLGFMLIVFISLYQVPMEHMRLAIMKTIGMTSAIVLFYVIVMLIRTKRDLFNVINVVTIAATSLYFIAFLQALFPSKTILPAFFEFSQRVADMEDIRAGTVRVFATFPGYELFTEYLVITVFLHYLMLRRTVGINARLVRISCMLLGMAVLFPTGTRAGVVILVLGWLMLTVFASDIMPRRDLFQMVFLAFALFYLSLPFFGDYYQLMIDRLLLLAEGQDDFTGRERVAQQALQGIIDRPLLGHGFYEAPGRFRGWVSMHIHSLYLALGYKLGLPGLLAFLGFVGTILLDAFRTMRNRAVSRELRLCLLFMVTIITLFLTDQVKIEFIRDPLPMHTTFTFLALAAAATRLAEREAQGESVS